MYRNKSNFYLSSDTLNEKLHLSIINPNKRKEDTLSINYKQTTFIQIAKAIFSTYGGCLKKETKEILEKKHGKEKVPVNFLCPEDLVDIQLDFYDLDNKITDIRSKNTIPRVFQKKETVSENERVENMIASLNQKGLDVLSKWLKVFDLNYDLQVEYAHEFCQIKLKNNNTGYLSNIHDMGKGINSILPLLVKTLSSNKNIFITEEIEQNLHPKAQAKIADFLVEATCNRDEFVKLKDKKKKEMKDSDSPGTDSDRLSAQYIIETHSEYLILRLLKLVKLEKIRPEFISINYVEMKNGRSIIKNLPIDNEGKFLMKWPDGFLPDADDEDM